MPAEWFLHTKRKFKRRTLKMTDQYLNVVRIHQSAFRRLIQKVLRMIHDVLIQRRAGSHHHRHRHCAAATGSPHALPCGCDGSGISRQYGNVETANVDTEFQRIGGYDAEDSAFSQSAFDSSPFIGQIPTTVPDDGLPEQANPKRL
jgi:hypothetical protein